MKSFFLVYDTFAHFEVALASYLMKHAGEVKTVGPSLDPVVSWENFRILPDLALGDPETETGDLLVIAGGEPAALNGREDLLSLIRLYVSARRPVAAICAAPVHLARAGVLSGRRYTSSAVRDSYPELPAEGFTGEDLTVDDRIITAKPNAYVDFALETGKMMNIYEDEADYAETIRFFREFRDAGG